jgi:hypothetical protein
MRMSGLVCGAVLAGMLFVASSPEAVARPKYNTEFWSMYEKEIGKLKDETKCAACHNGGDDKKKRNDYGQAMAEALVGDEVKGKKNETDVAKIKKALEMIAKKKSGTDGKTFGDLIQEGKLPGK